MRLSWVNEAWEEYLYWLDNDRKIIKRINKLIADCKRTPFTGIGKPEGLKHNLTGLWSRRIDDEHRLVYEVIESNEEGEPDMLLIHQCRRHY